MSDATQPALTEGWVGLRVPSVDRMLGGLASVRRKLDFAALVAAASFLALYLEPLRTLLRDWWVLPDAGHGLLLGPLAIYLAYRRGILDRALPAPWLGAFLILLGVLMRYGSGLMAEMFTMRLSMLVAGAGLVVYAWGFRQLLHWWLPAALLALAVPLPSVILGAIALPLQLQASQLGAALLELRDVPVAVAGNVIHLPGRTLFVTEACSGLRSLTALVSLALLVGAIWLRYPAMRALLLLCAIPIAVLLNGVRVFLTGFLVFYVDPALGEGFMHVTEGWIIFVAAFGMLGAGAWVLTRAETMWRERRA